jgi:hexosaminidase
MICPAKTLTILIHLTVLSTWSFLVPSQPEPAGPPGNRLNLLPIPAQIEFISECFRISDMFNVQIEGFRSKRITAAVKRMRSRLSDRTGTQVIQTATNAPGSSTGPAMFLSCKRSGKLEIYEDESYRLNVTSKRIMLTSETDIGILRGIETLLQLLTADDRGYYFRGVHITDSPRFTWRGLLIDAGRHFIPVEVIKRNLDGMCMVKMNVFHWHLTEDQGFRIECKTFPGLHELGSDGLFYTQEDVRDVIEYASERGIRVVPEFDIPGHSTSWLVGYPDLASAPGPYSIERKFGIFDPCFNPILEETYRFFDRFFKEMSELFPDSYIHIGGDEVNGNHWNANPDIQTFKEKNHIRDNHGLQAYFNRRIAAIITRHGKNMVGWEQILQPGLPPDTIIQSYLGEQSLIDAARKGYRVINSKANELYIDLLFPADFHYLYDPLPRHLPLKDEEKRLVLGSEATMWGELVSPETIDSRIWPRTAAIAERLWSPSQIRDLPDLYRRLDSISIQLEILGLSHLKNQDMMLRRLIRDRNIEPLKRLVEVIEPIILYDRPEWRERYNQQLPQTRVVDIAVPDARAARIFRQQTDAFLRHHDPAATRDLRDSLLVWKGNHQKLEPIIDKSPALTEIRNLSRMMSGIAEIGLTALDILTRDLPVNQKWLEASLNDIEKAKKPSGDCRLRIVSAIEKLLKNINK